MTPPQVDLPTIWRGCDWPAITLNWKDANGQPFNLQGWVPIAWTSAFSLNARVLNPPSAGVTQISLTNAQSAILKLGVVQWNWIWQQVSVNPPFVAEPVLAGSVEVKNPITPI